MTNYNNDMHESVIYSIAPNEIMDILGEDLTEGIVYYVQTDEQGKIKHFISADEKKWIDEGYITPEIRAMVMDSLKIYDEINEYLKMGMDVEFDGESIMLNNEEYYKVALGTKHEEKSGYPCVLCAGGSLVCRGCLRPVRQPDAQRQAPAAAGAHRGEVYRGCGQHRP